MAMSLFSLTEPSLDLAIASALLNCQHPTQQYHKSDVLVASSAFLPLPLPNCALETPTSLLSCVPIQPLPLAKTWDITEELAGLGDLSSVVIAPAEFAVPPCKFWSPIFDFRCYHDKSSMIGPFSVHSDDSQNHRCRTTWWKSSENGSVSGRSACSTACFEVPRSISTSSVSSSRSSSTSSKSSSRSQRFLHKAKDLFCEMVASDILDEICTSSEFAARPIHAQLKPLNGCMPRFPACETSSPKTVSPDVSERLESRETRARAESGVLEQVRQRESVTAICNTNALTSVGACANSALALRPVYPSKIKFGKSPLELSMGAVPSVRQIGANLVCKPVFPHVSAPCNHPLILGV